MRGKQLNGCNVESRVTDGKVSHAKKETLTLPLTLRYSLESLRSGAHRSQLGTRLTRPWRVLELGE